MFINRKWSSKEKDIISFILFNNRSYEHIFNFVPSYTEKEEYFILRLEMLMIEANKEIVNATEYYVNVNDIDYSAPDIQYTREDVIVLTEKYLQSTDKLTQTEKEFLLKRGISLELAKEYKLGSLSYFTENTDLHILGTLAHPLFRKFLPEGMENGGILIPLFNSSNELINCTVRKISNVGRLKYSQACPEVDIWGLDMLHLSNEVWICEGLFDMMAVHSLGKSALSVSSAHWSSFQYLQILKHIDKSRCINIFADNDQVGLRNAFKMKWILEKFGYTVYTYCSEYKDASEHVFEHQKIINDLQQIQITNEMIENSQLTTIDLVDRLKNRQF